MAFGRLPEVARDKRPVPKPLSVAISELNDLLTSLSTPSPNGPAYAFAILFHAANAVVKAHTEENARKLERVPRRIDRFKEFDGPEEKDDVIPLWQPNEDDLEINQTKKKEDTK